MRKVVYSIQTHPGHESRCYMDTMDEEKIADFVKGIMGPDDKWVVMDVGDSFYEQCRTTNIPEFQFLVRGLWKAKPPASTGPRKPVPQVPVEVWATPLDDVDYMAEVRAICGGSS